MIHNRRGTLILLTHELTQDTWMNYIKNLSPLYIVSHYLQVGKNKKNIPSDYSAIAPLIFF